MISEDTIAMAAKPNIAKALGETPALHGPKPDGRRQKNPFG